MIIGNFEKAQELILELEKIVAGEKTFAEALEEEKKLAARFGKISLLYFVKDRYDESAVAVITDVLTDGIELHWDTLERTVKVIGTESLESISISEALAQTVTSIFESI